MLSLVRSLGPLPGCFFFFFLGPRMLTMSKNKDEPMWRKGLLCPFPLQKNGNLNAGAVVGLKSTIAECTKMEERAIVPVSDAKLLGSGLSTFFFFFWKHKNVKVPRRRKRWSKIDSLQSPKRMQHKNRIRHTIILEKGKNGCRARPAPQQPPQKFPNSSYNHSRPINSASFSWDDTPNPSKCLLWVQGELTRAETAWAKRVRTTVKLHNDFTTEKYRPSREMFIMSSERAHTAITAPWNFSYSPANLVVLPLQRALIEQSWSPERQAALLPAALQATIEELWPGRGKPCIFGSKNGSSYLGQKGDWEYGCWVWFCLLCTGAWVFHVGACFNLGLPFLGPLAGGWGCSWEPCFAHLMFELKTQPLPASS